ncbi:MAG: phage terminase small subunit P27 family [Firmicutes bacterium]|nr:phage terminase small subunit P27 family [Bacillota bacterium]
MARPRQPIELVVAKGKKHLTKAEIEERKKTELKVDLKNISIPKYLPTGLKDEFTEIASKLLEIGVMTELDEDCLARYLLSKQSYLQYTSMLNQATKKNKISEMEKLMTMQDKAFKQCRASANDLGLTIASRCKLVMPEVKEQPKENKFSKFGM